MYLDRFKTAKMPKIDILRKQQAEGMLPRECTGQRPDFIHALNNPRGGRDIAVIAEFKQASPSRGTIYKGITPLEAAMQYASGGADCLSVLTEKDYFAGELPFLEQMAPAKLPMLRKDFIFDPLQVIETASTPASAMLLIVRMVPDETVLRNLREQGEQYGIHSVVEIFNEEDLLSARKSGARIIQVNARDLDTLETDRGSCLRLAKEKRPGELWIAASGMDSPRHIREAASAGYDAVLIGTALMKDGTPGETLKKTLHFNNKPTT